MSENKPSSFTTQTFRGRQVFAALFVNQTARGRFQVQVPENGDFKLRISEGASFDIVDANATDGEAHIVLPAATFETVFHLQHNRRANTVLKVKDALYNVQDELTSNKYKWIDVNRFLGLGKRPVPVPAAWQSDDGADLVLSFEAQNLEGFQMLWYETDEPVDFPPGIAEIGAAGGVVELAGVGRLEVPVGALSEPQIIRLKELVEAPEYIEEYPGGQESRKFAAPIVRVVPENVAFAKDAQLTLELDVAVIGNNDPVVSNWSTLRAIEENSEPRWFAYLTGSNHYSFTPIREGGTYTRTLPGFVDPDDGFEVVSQDGGFSTQQAGCASDYVEFVIASKYRDPSDPTNYFNPTPYETFICQTFEYYATLIEAVGGYLPGDKYLDLLYPEYLQTNLRTRILIDDTRDNKPRTFLQGVYVKGFGNVLLEPTMIVPYIIIPFDSNGAEETFAHELWHVFQYANSLTALSGGTNYTRNEWLLEGPAVHMGARATKQFGQGDINNYSDQIVGNKSQMNVSMPSRENSYTTGGFFSHYAAKANGELSIAELAVKWNPQSELADFNLEYGKTAVTQEHNLIKANLTPIGDNNANVDASHTEETPGSVSGSVNYFATEYTKLKLDPALDNGNYSLYVRVKELDGKKSYGIKLDGGLTHSTIKELGEGYTKFKLEKKPSAANPNASTSDALFIPVSQGENNSFGYTIEYYLEDETTVRVNTSSAYSVGPWDPVTVNLNILGNDGEPYTGKMFVALDRNAGELRQLAPTYEEQSWTGAWGRFVDVKDGAVTLSYTAYHTRRDAGTKVYCDSDEPCIGRSARVKVSSCDYVYYGKALCPILGPGKDIAQDGEESNEGRIYSTWIAGLGGTQQLYVTAGSSGKIDISFGNLTDNAGRPLPDGFPIYVTDPYYGDIFYENGNMAAVWATVPIKDGTVNLQYKGPPSYGNCWPQVSIRDLITFDDSRFTESWYGTPYEINILPKDPECTK